MLDAIPASVRHFVIVGLSAILTWLSQVVSTHQTDPNASPITWQSIAWGVGGALVSAGLLWFTALTRQYGVGAPPPPGEPVINPADTGT